jgi:hypothetical protein
LSLIPGLGVKALHDRPCRAYCSLRGRGIVLDMDSSVSPTHGEQENSVWKSAAMAKQDPEFFQVLICQVVQDIGLDRICAE